MEHWEQVWKFETARFLVTLDCTDELDADLSWDEDGSVQHEIEAGNFVNVCFRVRVSLDGREVGCSYLGNSVYRVNELIRFKRDGYFPQMLQEAIQEARLTLSKLPKLRVTA